MGRIISRFPIVMQGENADLNFSVKAYASESVLPATTDENTIAVITSTEITSWEFSADEPSVPTENMMWFISGSSSDVKFDALKNNSIIICPKSAMQYENGAWVDRIVLIYQNGKWMEWYVFTGGYLYNFGDECTKITGGWNISLGSKQETRFLLGSETNRDSTPSTAKTKIPIDFSKIGCLEVHFIKFCTSTSVGYCEIKIVDVDGNTVKSAKHEYSDGSDVEDFTMTVETYDVSKECYVVIEAGHTTSNRTTYATIDKVNAVGMEFTGGYLYNKGNECTEATGGWEQAYYKGYSGGTLMKESSYIRLDCTANTITVAKPKMSFDFSKFSTLTIKFTKVELMSSAKCYVEVASKLDGTDVQARLSITSSGAKTLDVSDVSGECNIYIYAHRPDSVSDLDVRFEEVTLT